MRQFLQLQSSNTSESVFIFPLSEMTFPLTSFKQNNPKELHNPPLPI